MQTPLLPVCTMEYIGSDLTHFWISDLSGLLGRFPMLEHAHTQNFFLLCLVDAGPGHVELDQYRIEFDQPKAIVFKPNCISTLSLPFSAHGKVIFFDEDFFSLRYNNNILSQFEFLRHEKTPYLRLSEDQFIVWRDLVDQIHTEFDKTDNHRITVLRSYLNILLIEWERHFTKKTGIAVRSSLNEKIVKFDRLVDEHFSQLKLPSAYAEMLNISPNHLTRLCKKETGQTPGELIRKRIILEAKRLLHYTPLSIKEIAESLGFESTSYFVTFFKKALSITPEQFRKREI